MQVEGSAVVVLPGWNKGVVGRWDGAGVLQGHRLYSSI